MSELVRDTGWIKSSYSSADSDNCVEVRMIDTIVAIRDSKNPDGPILRFGNLAWIQFRPQDNRDTPHA